MKTLNLNISCALIYIMTASNAFAACDNLCDDKWWSKISIKQLQQYTKNIESINIKNDYGFSPLHFAVSNNSPQKVELLLNLGANVNAKSHYGFTPIFHAVSQTGDLKIVNLLLEAGANVNVKNKDGITPLHYAAWGTPEKLQSLLSAGANPIAKSKSGLTPYDMARDNENLMGTEVLKILENANNN